LPEIGRAGLSFGLNELGAELVVSWTEQHNLASRKVMERLGLRLAGEIKARSLVEGHAGEYDEARFALYVNDRKP
jgi:RimJ/RimL family protein N-acetyltransferase